MLISNLVGVSYKTINKWISVLETSFIVYTLGPYHKNYNKRIVKSSKLYFYDTGLASALLNLRNTEDVNRHFAKGACSRILLSTRLSRISSIETLYQRTIFGMRQGPMKSICCSIKARSSFPLK